jgi:hypothetical protein
MAKLDLPPALDGCGSHPSAERYRSPVVRLGSRSRWPFTDDPGCSNQPFYHEGHEGTKVTKQALLIRARWAVAVACLARL